MGKDYAFEIDGYFWTFYWFC